MRIDPAQHGWMTAPETVAVMAALGEARFVGGAVRNALLGTGVVDIDIAVPMPPSEALARLKAKGIKVVETGLDHGTVTAIAGDPRLRDHLPAPRRGDRRPPCQGRLHRRLGRGRGAARLHHQCALCLRRWRDFRLCHRGRRSDRRQVRFMGDARARIAEDYLRVLRLFRFHAWYGKGEIDAEGLRAAAEAKDRLKPTFGGADGQGIAAPAGSGQSRAGAAGDGGDGNSVRTVAGRVAIAAAGKTGGAGCRSFLPARWGAAAGGAAARWRRGGARRRRRAETLQRRPHQAGTGAERREDRGATVGPGCAAAALSHRRGALQGQGAAAMGGRAGASRAPGACCWKWRTTGSGRAFRSPGAT